MKIAIGTMLIASIGLMGATGLGDTKKDEWTPESVNLALRQVAHNLYALCENHTERIEAVKQSDTNTFSIKINEYVDYDELPNIIDKVMRDFSLPKRYGVLLKNCNEDIVELGYTSFALERNEVACHGRDHNLDCSIVELIMYDTLDSEKPIWNYLLLTLLLGGVIGLLIYSYISSDNEGAQNEDTPNKKNDNSLTIGRYAFDHSNQSLSSEEGIITLTFRESKLLHYLVSNPNQVLSRDQIQANVWEDEGVIVGRSLDVFISRLRKILNSDSSLKIKSVHGVGYRFEVG